MRMLITGYFFLCLLACGPVKNPAPKITVDSTPQKNNVAVTIHQSPGNIPAPAFDKIHPNAKLMLKESFYFDSPDAAGPFGNREGIEAYKAFYTWRQKNTLNNPKTFLVEHINSLGYPKFDIKESNLANIILYMQQYEFGNRFIAGIDAAIVAVAFGQLYLEGIIDKDVKELTKTAITRQLKPDLLAMWGEPDKTERSEKFTKMLAILDK